MIDMDAHEYGDNYGNSGDIMLNDSDVVCSNCQIECEIEWRARMSLADAQRTILRHFCGKSDIWVDEYRVKRFAQYQRRVGARTRYSCYSFSTIRDLLTLHGLSPLYTSAMVNYGNRSHRFGKKLDICTYPFSELKTTNCVHSFYAFAADSSLKENNTWPRIFVVKRSLEIANVEACYDEDSANDNVDSEVINDKVTMQFEDNSGIDADGKDTAISAACAKTIENAFADYERTEMDRSDNNLGVAYVRKIYCLIPLSDQNEEEDAKEKSRNATGFVRLAVYSIFDEYQQIRHEIGLEYEFDEKERATFNEASGHLSTMACISSRISCISVDAVHLDAILCAMSQMVDRIVSPYVDYVEKPMIKINIDWLEGITSLSMIRMLSYTMPREWMENEENFVYSMLGRLRSLKNADQSLLQYHYFLRRKRDGERLYATYDGGHLLCMSNGIRLDLRQCLFSGAEDDRKRVTDNVDDVYRHLFSVDFIYQMEIVNKKNYYITEVVAVRHSYSTVLCSLVHTFSPSRNFYRATDEQIWPYGLIGSGLDNHGTSSLIDFWVTSACSDASNGLLTRDFVDRLRRDRHKDDRRSGDKDPCYLAGDEDDDEMASMVSLEPSPNDYRDRHVVNDNMDNEIPLAVSCSEDSLTQQEENNDESIRSVTTSDIDDFSKIPKRTNASHCQLGNERGITQRETHSRFFVPISARDSRRYLIALNTALLSSVAKSDASCDSAPVKLHVNVPIDVDSLNPRELLDYYRSYVMRILNILFLCGEHSRCIDYAYKHFSREYAAHVCAEFEHHRCCLSTNMTIDANLDDELDTVNIDGYLLYREKNDGMIANRSRRRLTNVALPCALPWPLIERGELTAVLKLKPFQTVELLMRVNIERVVTDGADAIIRLSSIQFLSQLHADGSPSIFFTCTFLTTTDPDRQGVAVPHRIADNNDNVMQHLRSVEPDFKSAHWTRYDGKTMKVFVDPRLELIDGQVYEFLCYNELELYLIATRPDKVLPDDETKINSILLARNSSEQFFIL